MSDPLSERGIRARNFLKSKTDGVLSTVSLELPGYPFGSVTPYALDNDCNPIILISGIAQHTKNINADSKVSLTIVSGEDDVQANARLTFIGDASITEDEAAKEHYLRKFPQANKYFEAHDFYFYKIDLKRARYIEGFGKIWWLDPDELLLKNIFPLEQEQMILNHMNEDHKAALAKYCAEFEFGLEPDEFAMTAIDQEGCDISAAGRHTRIPFPEILTDSSQARSMLVSMAKA